VPFKSLDPGSGMGKKSRSGSGMFFPDHIAKSIETIFWVKILKFFDEDPYAGSGPGNLFDTGSGMKKIRIRYKHSASATLPARLGIFIGRYRDRVIT
jgi:hypothetical protein